MKARDLFNLSIGKYELTDGIYNYILDVDISGYDGGRIYFIYEKGFLHIGHICLQEDFVNKDGGYRFYEGDIRYKILTTSSGIGGLTIHSNETYNLLYNLKFIPRGSFLTFVERTKE